MTSTDAYNNRTLIDIKFQCPDKDHCMRTIILCCDDEIRCEQIQKMNAF
jgi:hypothetical protein